MHELFEDRADAGRRLAREVAALNLADPVVLALPRGGVIVALPIALALSAPLDLLLASKIGARGQAELAVAAVAETPDGAEPALVIDEELAATPEAQAEVRARVPAVLFEMARRRAAYLGGRAPVPVMGRAAVLVDDGIATGSTVRAALASLKARRPSRIVLAAPVGPASQVHALAREVDAVVCLASPAWFGAVSTFYHSFEQVSDDEVLAALAAAAAGV
jgi:putative phosphoribosyl transferase